MSNNEVLLDIMIDGRFYTQLRYTKRGFPQMVDGVITEVHKSKDIEDFVFEKLPSLKGKKNVNIGFAQQKVFLR
jgi:hypothetical protein